MIIIGYPGIGKSTIVKTNPGQGYIDLESSAFGINSFEDPITRGDMRPNGWDLVYCRVALDLSRQGYTVFMSSHEGVWKTLIELMEEQDEIKVCYPSLYLKSDWLKRLRERCQCCTDDDKEKEKRALLRAIDHYDADITRLHNSSFEEIIIKSMDYYLEKLIFSDDCENKCGFHVDENAKGEETV